MSNVRATHPVRVLGIYGGSEDKERDRKLRSNLEKVLQTSGALGAEQTFMDLNAFDFPSHNARPTNVVTDDLLPLAAMVERAEVLVFATPIHWRLPSLRMVAFIHHVLAPLEWNTNGGDGFKLWNKTAAILSVCNDDGSTIMAAAFADTLSNMGCDVPRWALHHTNTSMKEGSSENNWQEYPEMLAPILIDHATRMRHSPHFTQITHQLKMMGGLS